MTICSCIEKAWRKRLRVSLKFYGVTAWLTNNCNTIITQYSKMSDFFLMFACSNFPFHASVIMIYCSILLLRWTQLCLLLTLSKSVFFELPVLVPFVLYLIRLLSAGVSLNCVSRIQYKCSFFWPWENQYMVHGFDSISITQFPAMICSVSLKVP